MPSSWDIVTCHLIWMATGTSAPKSGPSSAQGFMRYWNMKTSNQRTCSATGVIRWKANLSELYSCDELRRWCGSFFIDPCSDSATHQEVLMRILCGFFLSTLNMPSPQYCGRTQPPYRLMSDYASRTSYFECWLLYSGTICFIRRTVAISSNCSALSMSCWMTSAISA